MAIRRVVAPVPQPEPASHFRSATRDVSFLRSDSRCRRYVSALSNVTPRYLGSEQKGRFSLLYLTLSSRLVSLLLSWKTADTDFVVMSFSFQVWRYSLTVACSAPLPLPPSLNQHAGLLDHQHMHIFWRQWLAGQRCRCCRESAPGQIPVRCPS